MTSFSDAKASTPAQPASTLTRPASPRKGDLRRFSEGAAQLGVSLNHIRNLVAAGLLEKVKVGKRAVRLRADQLDKIAQHGI